MYVPASGDKEFRQAEIISDVIQHAYNGETGLVDAISHDYVIVLSQDCDLLRDFERRAIDKPSPLNGVLVFELHTLAGIQPSLSYGSAELKHIRQHNRERFHCLPAVPAALDALGQGLPELFLDFRRFFTIPPVELYRQSRDAETALPEGGRPVCRRCRLEMPYREHLQSRMAFYSQRVALPDPMDPPQTIALPKNPPT